MWTDSGWKRAGDVTTADCLVGPSGEWSAVVGVFPQGITEAFEVKFSDDTSLVTSGDHRWEATNRDGRTAIVTTAELRDDPHLQWNDGHYKWRIPMMEPAAGTQNDLPIDPYVFGCWLGDGSSYRAEITSEDPEVLDAFDAEYERGVRTHQNGGSAATVGYLGLQRKLRELGVLGNKHVPDEYLSASRDQRLALLQGLLDTDGSFAKSSKQIEFANKRLNLIEAVEWLVWSLGGTVRRHSRVIDGTTYWRVFIQPGDWEPFRLDRKQPTKKRSPIRTIHSVKRVGDRETVCFSVDNERSLFAAGREMILTHNTELLLHLIVRCLMRWPEMRIGYATYSADLAKAKSTRARRLADELGVALVTDRAEEWRTAAGGGVLARGVGGGWTGRGLDLLIVDDPVKDRAEAESPTMRSRIYDWFNDAAYTRLEPGSSVIVNMARWHQGDLAGKLLDEPEGNWQYLRLPAICDAADDLLGRKIGEPLWPERWDAVKLADRMRNEFTAASLYQGRPRPRGAALFRDVYYYDHLPTEGYRSAIGLDLAYTAKSHADYSVVGAFAGVGDVTYVIDIQRYQIAAAQFAQVFAAFQAEHGGRARIYYGGGAEKAAIEHLETVAGAGINAQPAVVDKFVRAQPAATAWNDGRILLPRNAPWVADFVDEVCSFTGVHDDHDDQVDMLAAGFDEVAVTMPLDYRSVEQRRTRALGRGWA